MANWLLLLLFYLLFWKKSVRWKQRMLHSGEIRKYQIVKSDVWNLTTSVPSIWKYEIFLPLFCCCLLSVMFCCQSVRLIIFVKSKQIHSVENTSIYIECQQSFPRSPAITNNEDEKKISMINKGQIVMTTSNVWRHLTPKKRDQSIKL